MSSKPETVLYLGMADDIMQPLNMIPEVEIIYVISLFDKYYSSGRTWESQMSDIKNVLTTGRKKYKHYGYMDKIGEEKCDRLSGGRCKITKETLDDRIWSLSFDYDGISRKLIYYHNRDYMLTWPVDIVGVKHLITSGSVSIYDMGTPEYKKFRNMMKERCERNFFVYAYNDTLHRFIVADEIITVKDAKNKHGSEIGVVKVERRYIDQIFDIENYVYDYTPDSTDED